MFEKMSDQLQKSVQPLNELVSINAKAIEALAQQQTNLFNNSLEASVAYSQNLWTQKDVAGAMEQQKAYSEKMQEKLTDAAKDAYAVIADAQEKAGEIFKGAFVQVQEAAAAAAPAAAKATKAAK